MLLHDLPENIAGKIFPQLGDDIIEFSANPKPSHCIGCFGCWTKTPGACVIKDRANVLPSMLAASYEFNIVSKITYGGFSVPVKASLDRSISYMLPTFCIRKDEMHHKSRYDNSFILNIYFYSDGHISDREKILAKNLVGANGINFGAKKCYLRFYESLGQLRGAIS